MRDMSPVEIGKYELRALLFWAVVGLTKSAGGAYVDAADIVRRLAKRIDFVLPVKPAFRQ